jgi:hypothetical protein
MSNEVKDRMLRLLTQVDDAKAKDVVLQAERNCYKQQIKKFEPLTTAARPWSGFLNF